MTQPGQPHPEEDERVISEAVEAATLWGDRGMQQPTAEAVGAALALAASIDRGDVRAEDVGWEEAEAVTKTTKKVIGGPNGK